MTEEIAISLKNVSKRFQRYAQPVDRLKEVFIPGKSRAIEFWALRDINLDIPKGQTVGLVGRNGSGKSTLLQIIAGTLTPTTGEVHVKGRISALLELGSGFNPEFTGRQNVFFNGRLLGLSQKEIEAKFDEIAGFADIGDFIDQPVKTYSSGMFVRLAFAVAVNVEPEILIVDEALAVGDVVFQHRCMRRMRSLMDSGVTTLFVSHDPGAIKTLCNSAIMIHEGKIHTSGLPNAVIIDYLKLITDIELNLEKPVKDTHINESTPENQKLNLKDLNYLNIDDELLSQQPKAQLKRRGSGKAVIEQVKMLDNLGQDAGDSPIFSFNDKVTLMVKIKAFTQLQNCIVGFFICDKNGNELIGSNTLEENTHLGTIDIGNELVVKFKLPLPLRPGSYNVTVAVTENDSVVMYDWIDNAMVFQILPPNTGKKIHALIDINMETEAIKIS
ncbi:ABC transporter ATP-binding protein [Calothrix sp. FACHB-1219]|uniref:ABC transporter ATP-binding protein n=1 Tax=unclassified Calothrix TaxID=2619626 RepID=UPI0016820964|nr:MULTISPECIES: ABC transporter ATP-binding protein [unclassified Calothrix]MBD2206521.1 ABC transporter ATP-binding protein [Calothrix sp. FACHB-168]MBD2221317.1 ABC transporter ATP-binding protein [Calothrix sp. FACHB-1219]